MCSHFFYNNGQMLELESMAYYIIGRTVFVCLFLRSQHLVYLPLSSTSNTLLNIIFKTLLVSFVKHLLAKKQKHLFPNFGQNAETGTADSPDIFLMYTIFQNLQIFADNCFYLLQIIFIL